MGLQKVKHNWASFHFYVNVNINMKLAFWMYEGELHVSLYQQPLWGELWHHRRFKKNASWDLLSLGKNYNPTEKENNLEVEKIRIYNEKIN